jgi:hypothetical protein
MKTGAELRRREVVAATLMPAAGWANETNEIPMSKSTSNPAGCQCKQHLFSVKDEPDVICRDYMDDEPEQTLPFLPNASEFLRSEK